MPVTITKTRRTLLLLCLLCAARSSFAQKTTKKPATVSIFGKANASFTSHITYAQMLTGPAITCTEADAEVTGYTISFLPKGKDYYGPFKVNGSNKLQPQVIAFLKGLQDSSIANTRIFVENIIVKRNGREEAPQTMALLATLK